MTHVWQTRWLTESKQLTVAWHVDDLKASHKRLKVLEEFARQLNAEFRKETPIVESYGKQHDYYLGMMLDYSQPGEVKITTIMDCIKLILHDVPKDMSRTAATLAGNHLGEQKQPRVAGRREERHFCAHHDAITLPESMSPAPYLSSRVIFMWGIAQGRR